MHLKLSLPKIQLKSSPSLKDVPSLVFLSLANGISMLEPFTKDSPLNHTFSYSYLYLDSPALNLPGSVTQSDQ